MQELKIIPLGGTTTVQKNLYVYEYGNDIIILDCGIGFPDAETLGVDLIIPDFSYVLNNREKVRGIIITHGHNDHRSALPYLLKEYKFDVYAMPFVKGLIEKDLQEYTNLKDFRVNAFYPDQVITLGQFKLHPYRVNHSIPDTLGFAIDVPVGRIFHNSDFKFDWTPVMDKPFDVQKAARLASEHPNGVLALLSDCLGSTTEGFTESESKIQGHFETLIEKHPNNQIFITTVSSNVSRIYQAIEASIKYGRKIVIAGRSIRNTMEVAREHGYIKRDPKYFVDAKSAHSHEQNKLTYIIAGCYGQKNSTLTRVSLGEHSSIKLEEKSVVIFSADPIPNSVGVTNTLIDNLYKSNAEVYYSDIQDNLHVSGHGSQGDMLLLANIVRPKYFIPIGGNVKHMRSYSKLIQTLGVDEKRILQLMDGQEMFFKNGNVRLGKQLKLKDVYVDGNLVGDVGTRVLNDRARMAEHGMVVVMVNGNNIEIISRGFVFMKKSHELINKAKSLIQKSMKNKKKTKDQKINLERNLQKFFYKETGREPLILVTIV